jgi:hypothetical protein
MPPNSAGTQAAITALPLHGLDILEGKTALAIVLVRTGREISGMLFSKRDEARSRCGIG